MVFDKKAQMMDAGMILVRSDEPFGRMLGMVKTAMTPFGKVWRKTDLEGSVLPDSLPEFDLFFGPFYPLEEALYFGLGSRRRRGSLRPHFPGRKPEHPAARDHLYPPHFCLCFGCHLHPRNRTLPTRLLGTRRVDRLPLDCSRPEQPEGCRADNG